MTTTEKEDDDRINSEKGGLSKGFVDRKMKNVTQQERAAMANPSPQRQRGRKGRNEA